MLLYDQMGAYEMDGKCIARIWKRETRMQFCLGTEGKETLEAPNCVWKDTIRMDPNMNVM